MERAAAKIVLINSCFRRSRPRTPSRPDPTFQAFVSESCDGAGGNVHTETTSSESANVLGPNCFRQRANKHQLTPPTTMAACSVVLVVRPLECLELQLVDVSTFLHIFAVA